MIPYKPINPRNTRRARWHNYRSRSLYMITVTKRKATPFFCSIEGSPQLPIVELTPIGKIIAQQLLELQSNFKHLEIFDYVIMPDHIHFIVYFHQDTDYHLGKVIGSFKGACSRHLRDLTGEETDSVFCDGFHDRILFKPGQLEIVKRYIADNPRRLLIKRRFPDLFTRKLKISINGESFEAIGNIFLLRNPLIEQVRVSREFSEERHRENDLRWRLTIEEGGVLVSPFISPKEKVYRDLAVENGGLVIQLEENGFGERYKPSGRFFELCAEGRLLLIAPMVHHYSQVVMTREMALHLNSLAACISCGEFTASFSK